MSKTSFETKSCGRCGGSGRHSFNLMHGDRCYGCGGTGFQLTKRGGAARNFYLESLEKPLSEVKAGDQIYDYINLGNKKVWSLVISIAPDMGVKYGREEFGDRMKVEMRRGSVLHGLGGLRPASVVLSVTLAELDEKIAAANAYQATLGVNGKPLKKAKVAA